MLLINVNRFWRNGLVTIRVQGFLEYRSKYLKKWNNSGLLRKGGKDYY